MRERTGEGSVLVRGGVIGLLLLLVTGTIASATVVVNGGVDCWATRPPSTAQLPQFPPGYFTAPVGRTSLLVPSQAIAVNGVPAPPPGVCDPCAAPIITWTDQHGNPVQPGDKHGVNQTVTQPAVDTCVRRNAPASLTTVGSPVPVPVEILFLHLRGTITVPMNTGPSCIYQVDISLTGTQSVGSVSFTPTAPDLRSGTMTLGSLPVGTQITFTPTSGCDSALSQNGNTTFADTPGTYALTATGVPALNSVGTAVLIAALILGMAFMLWRRRRMNAEA